MKVELIGDEPLLQEYPICAFGDIVSLEKEEGEVYYLVAHRDTILPVEDKIRRRIRKPAFLVNLDSGEIKPFILGEPYKVYPHAKLVLDAGFLAEERCT